MNACVRRLIHTNLISYVKVSSLRRAVVTCHGHGGVQASLLPVDKKFAFTDISDKLMDLSLRNSYVRSKVSDPVVVPRGEIGIPISVIIRDIELPTLNNKEMIDPVENVVEKKAHRMIRIRKKKMKKHKWKKLQKKMKFVFAKVKRKRKARKEAILKEELKMILKEGETYNPEGELNTKLDILTWGKPINRVRGFFSPKWVVDEYLAEEKKKKAMEDRLAVCLRKIQ